MRTMRWTGSVLVGALVAAVLALPAGRPASATSHELPTLLGWGPGTFAALVDDAQRLEELTGKTPAIGLLPFTVEQDWTAPWIAPRLTQVHDLGVTTYVELTTDDLGALASGGRDAQLDAMVATLGGWVQGQAGRRLIVAPLPEMNLTEHAWGGDPARYKLAYHRVRARFLDAGLAPSQVRFVFAPNGLSSPGFGYPEFYPGDGAVDLVGFAKLNRGAPWRDYAETFQRHIDELRATVTTTKPILVTTTGSVTSGGDRAGWLHDMFTKLASDELNPQVIGAVYFNRDLRDRGDVDYRVLVDGALDPTFTADYRDRWSDPARTDFLFDGSLDGWVTARGGTPAARFADTAASAFRDDVDWVAAASITTGCRPDHYCPSAHVTRGQMATFLARALDLPPSGEDRFSDDDGSVHEASIQAVAAAGITSGCSADGARYCPDAPVTRAQMASFLDAALDLPPASREDAFTDDDGNQHEAAIDRVASAGITSGCTPTRFCPGERVTRGQMAAFLHRALG